MSLVTAKPQKHSVLQRFQEWCNWLRSFNRWQNAQRHVHIGCLFVRVTIHPT